MPCRPVVTSVELSLGAVKATWSGTQKVPEGAAPGNCFSA